MVGGLQGQSKDVGAEVWKDDLVADLKLGSGGIFEMWLNFIGDNG